MKAVTSLKLQISNTFISRLQVQISDDGLTEMRARSQARCHYPTPVCKIMGIMTVMKVKVMYYNETFASLFIVFRPHDFSRSPPL